jgi:uncharacterized membrane protein
MRLMGGTASRAVQFVAVIENRRFAVGVKFDQHIDIGAPADKVWSIISNTETWPMWFPDLEQVTGMNQVGSGSVFQWSSGGETGSGSIADADAGAKHLQVVTQLGGNQVTHIFDIESAGGFLGLGGDGTRLRYMMEYDPPGGFLGDFVAGGNPKDSLKVKHTLEKVKGLAEGHA